MCIHTHTYAQICFRRALTASAAMHTTFNVLCVALNFLFAFRKSVHIVYKSANEETHATDGIGEKNVRCVRIEVCTHEGKKEEKRTCLKLRIYFIPIAMIALHRSAQRTRCRMGKKSKPNGTKYIV